MRIYTYTYTVRCRYNIYTHTQTRQISERKACWDDLVLCSAFRGCTGASVTKGQVRLAGTSTGGGVVVEVVEVVVAAAAAAGAMPVALQRTRLAVVVATCSWINSSTRCSRRCCRQRWWSQRYLQSCRSPAGQVATMEAVVIIIIISITTNHHHQRQQ